MTRAQRQRHLDTCLRAQSGQALPPVPAVYRRLLPLNPLALRRQIGHQQALLVRPPRGLGVPGLLPAAPPRLGATP